MDSTSPVSKTPCSLRDGRPRSMRNRPLRSVITAPRRSFVVTVAACWALALCQTISADTTYRWVDQNGNPVLSDRPPEAGVPYTEVGVDGGFRRYPKPTDINEPDVSESDATGVTPTALSSSSKTSSNTRIEIASPQPDLCDQAQDNIFKLETFPRMRMQDDTGEVRFMTVEERSAQLATTYRVREANCDFD